MKKDRSVALWVFDTSALLCLRGGEPEADQVGEILQAHGAGRRVLVSFMSLMELFYVVYQKEGRERAEWTHLHTLQLPIKVVESDEDLRLRAGRLKARFSLSVGDAWVAATAWQANAALVHKDTDFSSLRDVIRLAPLKK